MDSQRESIADQMPSVEKEIKAMGLTWVEAEMVALVRIGGRQRVKASCYARS